MSLIRWSPFFEPLETFEPLFGGSSSLIPAINMYDTKEALVIETSLPGIDPKHVELSIENNLLTMKGSSERKTEVDEKNYYRKEIRSGSFVRQVALPSGVNEGTAKASYENGILKVTFSKIKLPAPKKITITSSKNT